MKRKGDSVKVNDPVASLRALLGNDVLLLHWPSGTKGSEKRWKHLTVAAMDDPKYVRNLARGNIGVAQGNASNGVCSIDIDIDEEVEKFLAVNPKLVTSLRTMGQRGCNIHFRVIGASPASKKIKTVSGVKWGEVRANGSQTIIHGKHPSGSHYRIIVESPPIEIADVSEIAWPAHVINPFSENKLTESPIHSPESCDLNTISCKPVPLCPVSLYDKNAGTDVLANINATRQRQEQLRLRFPNLAALYEKHVEPKFKAAVGHRNGFIVEATPFIYCIVGSSLALKLMDFFFEMHRQLFKDSPEQHQYEAKAMLKSVATTYHSGLMPKEGEIYAALPDIEQDAFRILRDLAFFVRPPHEPLTFFMSCKELGDRLQIDQREAHRILKRFCEDYRLIECRTKGKMWELGRKPQASEYKWMLSRA